MRRFDDSSKAPGKSLAILMLASGYLLVLTWGMSQTGEALSSAFGW